MQLLDGTLEQRMSSVEEGLIGLGTKVDNIQTTMDEFGEVQTEMFDNAERHASDFKDAIEGSRREFKAWKQEMMNKMGGRGQLYITALAVLGWLLFILHSYWQL